MHTKDYASMIQFLMEQYCLLPENALFVEDIAAWSRVGGFTEPDRDKPLKFLAEEPGGCRMLIRNYIPDTILEQRMNAVSVRNQTTRVAVDKAERLNSERKQLAYLFLAEFAASLPEIGEDERLRDDWAFKEMERLGFFRS